MSAWRSSVSSLSLLLLLAAPACSIKKMAVNKLGDALAEGASVYAMDEDPELIEAAVPFSLKLMESLLAESPRHAGLLAALASGFTQYSYAFVHLEAERLEERDLDAAEAARERAKKLYLRAREYGLRGLEIRHADLGRHLRAAPDSALDGVGASDLPLLYWTAVSWAGAIELSKDDPGLVGDLPFVEALIGRALELDETYDAGAIHGFLIAYEMGRPGGEGDPVEAARRHFERAIELSEGQLASPLVAMAESVAVPAQDRADFESLLERALAIDPEARPEWRLSNVIFQRRARWLLERADRLILD